jgi:hypothetical protein
LRLKPLLSDAVTLLSNTLHEGNRSKRMTFPPQIPRLGASRLSSVVLWLLMLGLACVTNAHAHHGGLGIEGDLVEWALKVDQWQAEAIDQGYRIKFLTYPRQPVVGVRTRVVFEIQSVTSGRYVSGLAPQLRVLAPDGGQRAVSLLETSGVVAYYETTVAFDRTGEHRLTFRATAADGTSFAATFRKTVKRSALIGDWATLTGNLAVLAAFAVTWIGLLLSVQRRFVAPRPPVKQ